MGNRETRRLPRGCVADDVTDATDLASVLARAGLDVVQVQGLPTVEAAALDTHARVVALKTRSAPTGEDYLINVRLVDACYESAATGQVVRVDG